MTRHTRNRQMKKLCKDKSLHGMYFKGSNTDIKGNIRVYKEFGDIDPDFEWKRVPMWGDGMPDVLFNYILFKSNKPWRRVMPVKDYQ